MENNRSVVRTRTDMEGRLREEAHHQGCAVDDALKKGIKNLARDTEVRFTKSLLRWKYRKEGRPEPVEEQLEAKSRQVTDLANEVLAKRGKTVWREFRKVYDGTKEKGEGSEK